MTAQAQPGIAPQFPDAQAEPTATAFREVHHTGTDVVEYGGRIFQAMTWDDSNGNVYLSWALTSPGQPFPVAQKGTYGGPGASGRLNPHRGALSDPDVVLAYSGGNLYANVVYVDGGQTQYEGYRWDPTAMDFGTAPTFSYAVGDAAYRHEYPNIDANVKGLVALTWQQSIDDEVTVSVASNNSYFPPYSFVQKVTFGRAYLAAGDITGSLLPCYQYNGFVGIPVKNPPKGLFEQTLHPDIAISEGDAADAVISSTFVRHYVDGDATRGNALFKILNKLAVHQFRYRCAQDNPGIDTVATHEWAYSENDIIGSPRIAAVSAQGGISRADVEVVIDRSRPNCGRGEYTILNYSKTNQFKLAPTVLNPNYPDRPAVEPVVAFYNSESQYVVTWSGQGYPDGNNWDVWALSMKAGGSFTYPGGGGGSPQPLAYSRVNSLLAETQWSPSVAARHLQPSKFQSAHLYADDAQQQVRFRFTNVQPGNLSGALRPATGGNGSTPTAPANRATTGLLQAFPNPADGAASITLHLQPGEQVRQVLVLDLTGRQVADLTPPKSADTAPELTLTWKANAAPAGSYVVRAVTTQRTETTPITRK